MTINLSELSDLQIISLISEASAELAARAGRPVVERVKAAQVKKVTVREPSDEQKDLVLRAKAKLRRGEYVVASDRYDVAGIAREFPEWVRLQHMPTESGASAWARAREWMSAPRAKER